MFSDPSQIHLKFWKCAAFSCCHFQCPMITKTRIDTNSVTKVESDRKNRSIKWVQTVVVVFDYHFWLSMLSETYSLFSVTFHCFLFCVLIEVFRKIVNRDMVTFMSNRHIHWMTSIYLLPIETCCLPNCSLGILHLLAFLHLVIVYDFTSNIPWERIPNLAFRLCSFRISEF